MQLSEAIRRIRACRATGTDFGLLFVRASKPYELRKVESAQLREAPIDTNGDHPDRASRRTQQLTDAWLYFTDNATHLPRQCRKRLLLQVRLGETWYPVEL